MIKVSELLRNDIHPLIHGALISRILVSENFDYFAAVSSYQVSTKISEDEFDFDSYSNDYVNTLNEITGCNLWISYRKYRSNFNFCSFRFGGKEKAIYIIENDLNITKESFYNKLYAKLFNETSWLIEDDINEEKKHFIRGFCELRGSIDTNRPYLTMDYFYDNTFELGKARLLNEYLSVPYYIININFRELQEQYVVAVNRRNTQLRLQLNWYANNIGLINDYKTKIVEKTHTTFSTTKRNNINFIQMHETTPSGSDLFLRRLMHFSVNIFGRHLTETDIAKLRNELGFDIQNERVSTFKRNKDIVELVRLYTVDECAGCKSIYNINDRTFTHRRTNRPYFEIHHNISLDSKVELDHEDNLVKLCPVCHTALKRGVGVESEQKRIIENILDNHENVSGFAEHFFDVVDYDTLIHEIYKSLR